MGIGDPVEVATLAVAALLSMTEGPYGMEYCSGQPREGVRAQIGIEATLDAGRLVGGSCDLVADMIDGAVWEEGVAAEPGMVFHNRRTCWSYMVLAVYSRSLSTRTVWSPWWNGVANVMRTLDRLIELWEVTSGERQPPPRPSFACSKDRNGRCQLFENRRQGQRQHLSLRA